MERGNKPVSNNIIGIDPGLTGAMAFIIRHKLSAGLETHSVPIEVISMPVIRAKKIELDIPEIRKKFSLLHYPHVFIEKAIPIPGQSSVATGTSMMNYGVLIGICVGLQIPYTLVHPATWKKVMMRDMPKEKNSSVVRAKQLFPHIEFKKNDHGKADAILIAEYGRRLLK